MLGEPHPEKRKQKPWVDLSLTVYTGMAINVLPFTCVVDWYRLDMTSSNFGLGLIAFLIAVFALTEYFFLLTIFTKPGYVPLNYYPPSLTKEQIEEHKQKAFDNERIDGLTLIRYCKYCDSFKPPRAHHCKKCNRCVLKMDHHCPWLFSCIGLRNHKYFFYFLFFATLSLSYVFLLHCFGLFSFFPKRKRRGGPIISNFQLKPFLVVVVGELICMSLILMVLALFFSQVISICYNYTALDERFHGQRLSKLRKRKVTKTDDNQSSLNESEFTDDDKFFPYDIGCVRNCYSFFKDNSGREAGFVFQKRSGTTNDEFQYTSQELLLLQEGKKEL